MKKTRYFNFSFKWIPLFCSLNTQTHHRIKMHQLNLTPHKDYILLYIPKNQTRCRDWALFTLTGLYKQFSNVLNHIYKTLTSFLVQVNTTPQKTMNFHALPAVNLSWTIRHNHFCYLLSFKILHYWEKIRTKLFQCKYFYEVLTGKMGDGLGCPGLSVKSLCYLMSPENPHSLTKKLPKKNHIPYIIVMYATWEIAKTA